MMLISRSISRPVIIGLRLIGIWPGSSYEIIVRCIWVANMMSAQVFQYRYIIKHISSGNLADVVDSVSTTLPYSLLFFKIISFWIKRGISKKVKSLKKEKFFYLPSFIESAILWIFYILSHYAHSIYIFALSSFLKTHKNRHSQVNDKFEHGGDELKKKLSGKLLLKFVLTDLCAACITIFFRIFKNILIGMSRDWIDTSIAKLNVDVMINKAELAYRCSNLIIGVYASAVFIYGGMFLEFSRQDQDDGFNITSGQLLIKMDLPFAYYESPMYEYVFVVQFLQLLATGISIAMLDALIITLILHIGGQIEMLHEALKNISIKDEKHGSLRNVIKSLTDHHYRIILNSEYIEKLFSYIALMQLLCNTIVICCIGFLIIVAVNSSGDIKILMKILLFYIAITLEAFIFSYAGEYLSSKSLSVSSSAYGSSWYLLEPRNRRVVILLMIRSQRSLTITAGKFMDLSMIGFATILKASASYVSVLYAMY